MLNALLRFSLRQRMLTIAGALVLLLAGLYAASELPVDVLPDLNRPRVVIMTEAHGMAPEEVETQITFPIETTVSGASGVEDVRSYSAPGLSVINVEFGWGSDIYKARQIVAERLAVVQEGMPEDSQPQLAPISSIMGQILLVGMVSEDGSTDPMELRTYADWVVRRRLLTVPGVAQVYVMGGGRMQMQVRVNPDLLRRYGVSLEEVVQAVEESNDNSSGGFLDEQGPYELVVRGIGRIKTVEDLRKVVVVTRGGRPLLLSDVAEVVEAAQVKRGDSAAFAREADGEMRGGRAVVLTITKQPEADTRRLTERIEAAFEDMSATLPPDIKIQSGLYRQKSFIDRAIDNVIEALSDGALLVVIVLFVFLLNYRTTFITLTAIPASILITGLVFTAFGLSINTMTLGGLAVAMGELVDDAIVDVENCLRRLRENRARENPLSDIVVVYQASSEIRNSIVFGTIIVVLVFMPLFALSGMEGRLFAPLGVAYIVSILSSLVISLTLTPVLVLYLMARNRVWPYLVAVVSPFAAWALVFLLLPELMHRFGADAAIAWMFGVEDASHRLAHTGWPLQLLAAIVLGPVLGLFVLVSEYFLGDERESFILKGLQWLAGGAIRFSVAAPDLVLAASLGAMLIAGAAVLRLERDFLPPFNEGAVQINVIVPPGVTLQRSEAIAQGVQNRLLEIEDITALVRKTGRAEMDEHAAGVHVSEMIATIDPESPRSREEILADIREVLEEAPASTSVEQPIAHLISHMLSGVKAQIAVKVFGENLTRLRQTAEQFKTAMADVPGVVDLQVEPQVAIPQLRIEVDADRLKTYGLRRADVVHLVETALGGEVVSQVFRGERQYDLLVRFDEPYREDLTAVRRLAVPLPEGGVVKLETAANVYRALGPNTINRENAQRRIVISCNTSGRGLVDVVNDIRNRLEPLTKELPPGYRVSYGGQFESQQSATQTIGLAFALAVLGMFLTLFAMFRSVNLSLQVMIALPAAFIGGVAALYLADQTLTVASMVGFISLSGIAARNGILLINHYIHLVKYEGETWTREMIVRAGQERVAPVLMTALTSGFGLLPLALAADQPGKELLHPIALVIVGGLITSTVMEFFLRPALFWRFGVAAAAQRADDEQAEPTLTGLEEYDD